MHIFSFHFLSNLDQFWILHSFDAKMQATAITRLNKSQLLDLFNKTDLSDKKK